MFKKRGQVTLFIILGILLLIALALVIIFRREITVFNPERVIPPEVASLVTFGDNCLQQISQDGLNLLAAQGGYIYLPDEIANNPLSHVDAGLKIPYWQYLTQNRIPSLPLMQAQLSRYIEEHFNDCLDNFAPFQQEYDIIVLGQPSVTVTFNDKNTLFKAIYPLEIRSKDGTKITDVNEFLATSPIKLKRVYDVARKIMETEAAEARLEKITVDLIALDPETPLSGVDFTCAQKIWRVDDVENKLKTLLRTNLPSVRIDKTDYLAVPEDQPYVLNHYVWSVTDLKYSDIKASIQFNENKPLLMQVSPRDGNFLKSGQQKGRDMASFVCIQMWKFTYSLRYPVVVTVEDAENNYDFNFAFDVQVKNNRASRDTLGTAPLYFTQFDATEEAYCAEENRYGDYQMNVYTYDNISDPLYGQQTRPLNQVNLTFTCLKYTCPVGQTEYQTGRVEAILSARFPYCSNGILRAKKAGYKMAEQFVTTAPGKEVSLYLTPLKTFTKYIVLKHNLVNGVVQGAQPLAAGETAFITLTYAKNNTVQHSATVSYPAMAGTDLMPLELLDGAEFPYQLEIYLMNENNLVGGFQGNWTPLWAELKNSQEVEFHVLYTGEPQTDQESLNLMMNLQTYSNQIAPDLK